MTTYTAVQGDTFESIARKMLGTETETGTIRKANPSLSEPLSAGASVFIPTSKQQSAISASGDQVTVLINDEEFTNFIEINFQNRFNSFDSCTITAPFEPDNLEFRKIFIPFSYADIDIFIGSELIFSGTQIGLTPSVTTTSKTITLEAYARCAVTNDSSLPVSSYPIELRGLKLDRIADEICRPFPFNVVSDVDTGATFETASIEQSDKIASFLLDLCKQRDIVLTNNADGDLLLTKAVDADSVAFLTNNSPVISVTPQHDEQNYFSDYSAILPIITGLPVAAYTAKNAKLTNVLRVNNFMALDALNGEEKLIAESRRSRGLANSIEYSVELATIRDPSGELYKPNTYVNLSYSDAMIYNDTKFFIRSVSMNLTPSSKTCSLDLVLPEAYNGEDVEVFPWEE